MKTARLYSARCSWRLAAAVLLAGSAAGWAQDVIPPSVPSGLATSNLFATALTLSWAAATDNIGVTGYEVFRNGASLGTTSTTSISISGLSPLTTYEFTVRARDAAGNWSAQSASAYARTWQRLHQWSGVLESWEDTDDEGNGLGTYSYSSDTYYFVGSATFKVYTDRTDLSLRLFRQSPWTQLGSSNGSVLSYTPPGSEGISIELTEGDGAYQAFVDVPPPPNQLPIANFNLTPASGRAPLAVSFNNNGSSDPDGFIVGYNWDFDNNGSTDATGSTTSFTYQNTGTAVISYSAKLTVVDSAGGTGSLTRSVTVYPAGSFGISVQNGTTSLPYQMSGATVTLNATTPPAGQVFGSWSIVSGSGTFGNANAASTTFIMGSTDTAVIANFVVDSSAPSVPSGLAVSNLSATSLILSWAAAIDNVGVTGYEVFRNGVSVGTATATTLSVTGLTPSTTYQFTVRAKDAANNWSAQSAVSYARTWQHLHSWGGTLYSWEDTDDDGNPLGTWSSSDDSYSFSTSEPFKVYSSGTSLKLTVNRWTPPTFYGETTVGAVISHTPTSYQSFTINVSEGEGSYQLYVDVPSANTLPIASFATTPSEGRGSVTVTVNGSSSSDPDGPAGSLAYAWDLDNNGSVDATGVTANRVYSNSGSTILYYYPRLTVTDIVGGTAQTTKQVIVHPPSSNSVVVQSGSSSSTYLSPGGVATITAAAPATGQAFLSWTLVSGSGTIGNPSDKTTTFTPTGTGGDALLKANYGQDIVAPSIPANLWASNGSATSVTLGWGASVDNVGIAGYEIYHDTTLLTTTSNTQVALANLTPGTVYRFTVRAVDASGLRSSSTDTMEVPTWQRLLSGLGTIESEEGEGTSVTFNFNVSAGGSIKFYTTGTTPTRGLLAGPTNYGWIEGNGGNFSAMRQVGSGAYTLTVSGNDGDVSGDFQVFVDFGDALRLDFSATPAAGNSPLAVAFDASKSFDPNGGPIVSYQWDLDDNGTVDASGVTAARTYSSGVYKAKLTATNSAGMTTSMTRMIVTQNMNVSPFGMPSSGASIPAPGLIASPTSGRVGTQVALSAPAQDTNNAPFHSWAAAIVEGARSASAVLTVSSFANSPIAVYWQTSANGQYQQPPISSISIGESLALVNQTFSVSSTIASAVGDSNGVVWNCIDYSTDFGATWVEGTLAAGTRWQGSPPYAQSQTLASSFSFPNPGWVFFRASGAIVGNLGTYAAYGKVLIRTGMETDQIAVINGSANPESGPAGTVATVTASPGFGSCWWELVLGSGTFSIPFGTPTYFTKGAGSVVLRANKGVPTYLSVISGQSNRQMGSVGSEFRLTANPAPEGSVFAEWKIKVGTGYFSAPTNAETSFYIGEGGATVEATYRLSGAPSVTIAASTFYPLAGEIVTVTATASDPDSDLASLTIDYAPGDGQPWVLGSASPYGAAQDPSSCVATGGAKTLTVRFLPPPLQGGRYRFRARASDAAGNLAREVETWILVYYDKPLTAISAITDALTVGGSTSESSPPSVVVPTGEYFTIYARTVNNSATLIEQGIDLLKAGESVWSLANADNQRLWTAAANGGSPVQAIEREKTFSATELGVGTHRFRSRGFDGNRNLYSDFQYVTVTVAAPVPPPPTIAVQPQPQTTTWGGSASFFVTASGSGTLSFQWWRDDTPIAGATLATLAISNAQLADMADYTVVVTSSNGGSVTSSPARLTVTVTNPSGDADGDGISNAIEFALGTNPAAPSTVNSGTVNPANLKIHKP